MAWEADNDFTHILPMSHVWAPGILSKVPGGDQDLACLAAILQREQIRPSDITVCGVGGSIQCALS